MLYTIGQTREEDMDYKRQLPWKEEEDKRKDSENVTKLKTKTKQNNMLWWTNIISKPYNYYMSYWWIGDKWLVYGKCSDYIHTFSPTCHTVISLMPCTVEETGLWSPWNVIHMYIYTGDSIKLLSPSMGVCPSQSSQTFSERGLHEELGLNKIAQTNI